MACYYILALSESSAEKLRDGRVVELVDSLDSGSSVHCGRAGSSPASPTKIKETSFRDVSFVIFVLRKRPEPILLQMSGGYLLAAGLDDGNSIIFTEGENVTKSRLAENI